MRFLQKSIGWVVKAIISNGSCGHLTDEGRIARILDDLCVLQSCPSMQQFRGHFGRNEWFEAISTTSFLADSVFTVR